MQFSYRLFLSITLVTLVISCDTNKKKLLYNNTLEKSKKYYVVLMAGQSNMIGLSDVSDLNTYSLPNNITYFNYSANTQLKKMPDTNFGPEVGVSRILHKEFEDLNFILIKYAVGDSSIEEWLSNGSSQIKRKVNFSNFYEKFYKNAQNIIKDYNTEVIALLWMQGETDARYKKNAKNYERNFNLLIKKFRQDFNDSILPIIFGKVNPKTKIYKFLDEVQDAQNNILKSLDNSYIIETDSFQKQTDGVHYSSQGILELGTEYGNILSEILKSR